MLIIFYVYVLGKLKLSQSNIVFVKATTFHSTCQQGFHVIYYGMK